jgi:hypothetical protein
MATAFSLLLNPQASCSAGKLLGRPVGKLADMRLIYGCGGV